MQHAITATATYIADRDTDDARTRRIRLLLVGIVAASAADLAVTIRHLCTFGLLEANPIAAFLIRATGSALVLSAYKGLTVAVCVALLYRLRGRRAAELAAWCCLAAMALVSYQWFAYTRHLAEIGTHVVAAADGVLRLD